MVAMKCRVTISANRCRPRERWNCSRTGISTCTRGSLELLRHKRRSLPFKGRARVGMGCECHETHPPTNLPLKGEALVYDAVVLGVRQSLIFVLRLLAG